MAPLIGDFQARRIGVLTAVALIFVITLLRVGALWVALTVLFEVSLGILAMLFTPLIAPRVRGAT